MTQYQLVTQPVPYVVATIEAATDPTDPLAVAVLHRDTCKQQRADPRRHALRARHPKTGAWIYYQGATS